MGLVEERMPILVKQGNVAVSMATGRSHKHNY